MKKPRYLIAFFICISIWLGIGFTFGQYHDSPEAVVNTLFEDVDNLKTIWLTEDFPATFFTNYEDGSYQFSLAKFKNMSLFNKLWWKFGLTVSSPILDIEGPVDSETCWGIRDNDYIFFGITDNVDIYHATINLQEPIVFTVTLENRELYAWYILGDESLIAAEAIYP